MHTFRSRDRRASRTVGNLVTARRPQAQGLDWSAIEPLSSFFGGGVSPDVTRRDDRMQRDAKFQTFKISIDINTVEKMPRPISAILKMRSATIAIPHICEAAPTLAYVWQLSTFTSLSGTNCIPL